MIPDDIKRTHIIRALRKITINGVPSRRQSTVYDLRYDRKRYPPKYVVSLAHQIAKGSEWPHYKFSGGIETNNFLIARGFQIVNKRGRQISLEPIEEDDAASFPEGRKKYVLHRKQERNPQIARRAKLLRLSKLGDLICDACGFSFSQRYGARGKGFIEAHHTTPISDLMGTVRTRLSDIALVCSNCHRMLHRRRPWLTMGQLRLILTRRPRRA